MRPKGFGSSPFECVTPVRVRGHRVILATWIETAAKGRLGGPVRAGIWSAAVIGTHPVQDNQRVSLELAADDLFLGTAAGLLDREQRGQQLLARPDSAPGASASGSIIARSSNAKMAIAPRVPTKTRSYVPTCRTAPSRSTRCSSGAEGSGRQPLDDGPGRRARLDL